MKAAWAVAEVDSCDWIIVMVSARLLRASMSPAGAGVGAGGPRIHRSRSDIAGTLEADQEVGNRKSGG